MGTRSRKPNPIQKKLSLLKSEREKQLFLRLLRIKRVGPELAYRIVKELGVKPCP